MGTGVGEAALLQAIGVGAATGAATSAITGGDPLKGALFGAAGGALMPGAGSMLGGAPAGTVGSTAAGATASAVPGVTATQSAFQSALPEVVGTAGSSVVPETARAGMTEALSATPNIAPATTQTFTPKTGFLDVFKGAGDSDTRAIGQRLGDFIVQNPMQAAMLGGGATTMMFGGGPGVPEPAGYEGPLKRFRYDPRFYRPAYAAGGGITDLPVSKKYAGGGDLGGYSDGGRMLKGPGDGMSDSIPAKIGRKQPARLADGEFVVPADVVSGLGNGSTDAGAKQLYAMMDKVRQARTGTKKQGKQIKSAKYLPA